MFGQATVFCALLAASSLACVGPTDAPLGAQGEATRTPASGVSAGGAQREGPASEQAARAGRAGSEREHTRRAQRTAPNVLLIVSEDNGPELGCYGDSSAKTPVLDRLAREGVLFWRAFVPYSVCSPSRACYLTGLYPQQNGQLGLATHKMAMYERYASIPSHLRAAGYRSGLIGKLHVNPAKAFRWDFRKISSANFGKRDMAAYAKAAAEFFAAGDAPFFLSINYPDAHYPLHRQQFGRPAQPIDEARPLPWVGASSKRLRRFTANYYNCLARLDEGVGLLLDALDKSGKARDTLVIYMGDHGAQFSRGKCSVYEAGLRVPLIVRWPRRAKAGHVARELVSSLDLLPTILRACGLDVPRELPGKPLQALLEGRAHKLRKHVFGITTGASPGLLGLQFSVRDESYKLIFTPAAGSENRAASAYLEGLNVHFAGGTREHELKAAPARVQRAYARWTRPPQLELYDLDKDPNEFDNLLEQPTPDHEARAIALLAALHDWQERIDDPFLDPANVEFFLKEQAAARGSKYRRDKSFRWGYLERFAKWRAARRAQRAR